MTNDTERIDRAIDPRFERTARRRGAVANALPDEESIADELGAALADVRKLLLVNSAHVMESLDALEDEHLATYDSYVRAIEQVQEVRIKHLREGGEVKSSGVLTDIILTMILGLIPGAGAVVLASGFRFLTSKILKGADGTAAGILRLLESKAKRSLKPAPLLRPTRGPDGQIPFEHLSQGLQRLQRVSEWNRRALRQMQSPRRGPRIGEVIRHYKTLKRVSGHPADRADVRRIRFWLRYGDTIERATDSLAGLAVNAFLAAPEAAKKERAARTRQRDYSFYGSDAAAVSLLMSAQHRLRHSQAFLNSVRRHVDLILHSGLTDDYAAADSLQDMSDVAAVFHHPPTPPEVRAHASRFLSLQAEITIWGALLGGKIKEFRHGRAKTLPRDQPLTGEEQDQQVFETRSGNSRGKFNGKFANLGIEKTILRYLVARFPHVSEKSQRAPEDAMLQELYNIKKVLDKEAKKLGVHGPLHEETGTLPDNVPDPSEAAWLFDTGIDHGVGAIGTNQADSEPPIDSDLPIDAEPGDSDPPSQPPANV